MSATTAVDSYDALSLTFSTESHLQTNTSRQTFSSNSTDSNDSTEATTNVSVFSDSFEFSARSSFSSTIYQAPLLRPAQSTQVQAQSLNIPLSSEEIEERYNTKLDDLYGIDTAERQEHQGALTGLKMIDPELAEKAMFLITLMGKDEADKFLSDISEFNNKINEVQTGDFSMNVVASSSSTTLDKVYSELRSNATQALEKYNSVISERFNIEINIESLNIGESAFCDPLVLDLDGDGIDLSGVEDGVLYDIDGDGVKEQTAFIRGDDALLYLDNNGNGLADSGLELFGDQEGDANGYAELARYDENNDGKIDELDTVYSKLRLWQDKNTDGVNQESESLTLLEAGIKSIQLKYDNLMQNDKNGNITAQTGQFTRVDGSTGYSADMLLQIQKSSNRVSNLLLA